MSEFVKFSNSASPPWGNTTKLVVALFIGALGIAFLMRFGDFIAIVLMSFVLAYLLYPVASFLRRAVRIPWVLSVIIVYFLMIVVLASLLTWGSLTLIEQVQNLIRFLQGTITTLPQLIEQISSQPYNVGPFIIDLTKLDLSAMVDQVLRLVQPLLANLGTIVTSLASNAAGMLGWASFALLTSYFILSGSKGLGRDIFNLQLPVYHEDSRRLGIELKRIWGSFFRGQLVIISIIVAIYVVLFGFLGLRYFYVLALLAGFSRFLPYVGAAIAWTTYGLVAYFQGYTLFGLPPLTYAFLVVAIAWATDGIYDNLFSPRIMGDALHVHPAAVLIAALIAFSLIGFMGMILAGPVVASLQLMANYTLRKMLDLDPWTEMNLISISPPSQPIPFWINVLNQSAPAREWLLGKFIPTRAWVWRKLLILRSNLISFRKSKGAKS